MEHLSFSLSRITPQKILSFALSSKLPLLVSATLLMMSLRKTVAAAIRRPMHDKRTEHIVINTLDLENTRPSTDDGFERTTAPQQSPRGSPCGVAIGTAPPCRGGANFLAHASMSQDTFHQVCGYNVKSRSLLIHRRSLLIICHSFAIKCQLSSTNHRSLLTRLNFFWSTWD